MIVDLGVLGGNIKLDDGGSAQSFFHGEANRWQSYLRSADPARDIVNDIIQANMSFGDALFDIYQSDKPNVILQAQIRRLVAEIQPVTFESGFGDQIRSAVIQNSLRDIESIRLSRLPSGARYWTTNQEIQRFVQQKLESVSSSLDFDLNGLLIEVSSLKDSIKDLENKYAQTKDMISSKLVDAEKKVDVAIGGMEGKWQAILASYQERLNLDAVSTLWKDRSSVHKSNAQRYGRAAGIAGVLTMPVVAFVAYLAFHYAGALMTARGAEFATHRLIFGTGATALVLTLLLWLTRVLVRLYMTEHHLHHDADGRAAQGDTYISLIANSEASKEDRHIVLASLFRPIRDGLVGDDGLPLLTPAGFASAAVSGDFSKKG